MDIAFDMFVETEVPDHEVIISRTDLKGVITYVNDTFASISGYRPEELIGQPHNILRHPDMPKSVYKDLWETIQSGKSWEGYVKNMRKDRGYYWVYAVVSGVYKEGRLLEYKSIRSPVSREKRLEMQRVYDSLRLKERDNVRAVLYLKADLYDKLTTKAKDTQKSIEELMGDLL